MGKLPIHLTDADLEELALLLREGQELLRQKRLRESERPPGEA